MSEAILDAFRHNAWATRVLIEFCRGLDEKQLTSGAPGVYGSVIETLKHLVTSEGYYTSLFTGALPDWDASDYDDATLRQIEAWAGDVGSIWEQVLRGRSAETTRCSVLCRTARCERCGPA